MATVNCDPRRASCGMQQNTQPSRKSNESRQNAPLEHHGGPPSPADSVYEVARRAVNFLDIHKTQDTAPQDTAPQDTAPRNTVPQYTVPQNTAPQNTAPQNAAPHDTTPWDIAPRVIAPRVIAPSIIDAQQVILDNTIGEVRTLERCNAMQTPPASHSSAQTSPVSHKREKTPPIRWSTIQTYPSCRDAITAAHDHATTTPETLQWATSKVKVSGSSTTGDAQAFCDIYAAGCESTDSCSPRPTSGLPSNNDFKSSAFSTDTCTLSDDSTPGTCFISAINATTTHGIPENGKYTAASEMAAYIPEIYPSGI
ncbi:hypothetical protein H0G86_000577 [Trichoderma simmonsii]|uniref:Uncharacterized protein n=1 Tax=Trichoderma simmonsii TaxID=1491479 RepID=A0A8G0KZW6_9HYPO|nr:hypothetical protein H0G86_000577 [Trichoderma simmonsii]